MYARALLWLLSRWSHASLSSWLCAAAGMMWAVGFIVSFLSRSFENNWKIYKLLAHQKISKEKVRKREEPMALVVLPSSASSCPTATLPPASWGAEFQVWGWGVAGSNSSFLP